MDKRIKTKMVFKLSNLNSNLPLTLGYLNPALNNSAQGNVLFLIYKGKFMDCWLFCSKQTLRQPRNRVTDWSIAQLLTDHWLVCGEIASNKNSHASQTTANNSEPSSNLSNKTFKDILQREAAVNFLKGNEFKAILPFKESVIFSVVCVLFINLFK